jgi:hypothetical protein
VAADDGGDEQGINGRILANDDFAYLGGQTLSECPQSGSRVDPRRLTAHPEVSGQHFVLLVMPDTAQNLHWCGVGGWGLCLWLDRWRGRDLWVE